MQGPPRVLCCAIFNKPPPVFKITLHVFAIHHTQLYYMTAYHTMNYSVNMFLGSNWNHTVLIFPSLICSVTMLLDLVQFAMTLS